MKSLTNYINEGLHISITEIELFAKEHGLKIKNKTKNSITIQKPNGEYINIDLMVGKAMFDGIDVTPQEIFDELAVARFDESKQDDEEVIYSSIDESGIMGILKNVKNGDLIEIVSAVTNTKDFAKSSAKREIINQLNKRGLMPDTIANAADTYYKVKPLAKRFLGEDIDVNKDK